MSSLEITGVEVRYGDVTAIAGLDLTIAHGDVLAVLGPSGCGKSTLLRAIAGLEPLHGGSIRLGDRDLAGVPTHRRDLGLMFQDHALFAHLDVAGNIEFGLRRSAMAAPDRRDRVAELLDLVDLAGYGSRRVDSLSGGEAQRVALARALAPAPGLLMLDEPLGSLDQVLREQLTSDLRRVFGRLDQTAIHVTHDQAEAFALADNVALLDGGRLVQCAPPAQLWNHPSSAFAARFVGHPNVWETDDEAVLIPERAIHPDADGQLAATVDIVEFREGRYRVTARAGERRIVYRTSDPPPVGAVVQLGYPASAVRVLADPEGASAAPGGAAYRVGDE